MIFLSQTRNWPYQNGQLRIRFTQPTELGRKLGLKVRVTVRLVNSRGEWRHSGTTLKRGAKVPITKLHVLSWGGGHITFAINDEEFVIDECFSPNRAASLSQRQVYRFATREWETTRDTMSVDPAMI